MSERVAHIGGSLNAATAFSLASRCSTTGPVATIDPPSQTSHPMVFMDTCSRSSIIVVRPAGSFLRIGGGLLGGLMACATGARCAQGAELAHL